MGLSFPHNDYFSVLWLQKKRVYTFSLPGAVGPHSTFSRPPLI